MSTEATFSLAGKTLAVARPAGQAEPLCLALEALGAQALRFPIIAISPLADTRALHATAARLAEYRIAFFVSPNAVEHAMSVFGGVAWPAHLQVAGVGPGTAKALAAHGFDRCIVPSTRFDTESVLALPEFSHAAIAGAGVLVLRGQHGREVLADTLRLRGAQVDTLSCYTRSAAELDARTLLEKPLHGLVITSSEGLHYLHECPGGARLLHTKTIFVSHARIAETAENLGSAQIVLTEPGDAGIVAGIQHHFRTQESSS